MKKVLRMLGQALVIVVMTLAVDFTLLATVFSGMKRSWADAATAYTEAYISTDYDHDLAAERQVPAGLGQHRLFLADRPLRIQDR